MLTDRDIFRHFAGDLSRYMTVTLNLGDLYQRWVEGGSLGNYASKDDDAKTITYDPETPLRLDNIILNQDDVFPVHIAFVLREEAELDCPITNRMIHFRQLVTEGDKEIVDGNVSFALSIGIDDGSAIRAVKAMSFSVALKRSMPFIRTL